VDVIYLKIKVNKCDARVEEIRNAGLLFSELADTLDIQREQIVEIDENSFKQEIKNIRNKFK
jgi:hypothetical protein